MLQKFKVKIMGVDLLVLWYLENDYDDTLPTIDGIFIIDSKGNYNIDETPNIVDLVSVDVLCEIHNEICNTLP